MTHEEIITSTVHVAIIATSIAILTALILKGSLTGRTLALGPTRDPGFPPFTFAGGAILSIAYVLVVAISRESPSQPLAMLASLFPFALIGLALGACNRELGGLRIVGLLPRHPMRDLRWAGAAIPTALFFSWTTGLVVTAISLYYGFTVEPVGHDALDQLLNDFSAATLLLIIVSAVIMAPLLEELVFRGIMQTSLLHVFGQSRWAAMLYTATLFSITHAWVVPWQNLFSLFVLGLIFGYLYERTGSLLPAILTHAGFNAANIIIALSMPR